MPCRPNTFVGVRRHPSTAGTFEVVIFELNEKDGTQSVLKSFQVHQTDVARETLKVRVSPDGKYAAIGTSIIPQSLLITYLSIFCSGRSWAEWVCYVTRGWPHHDAPSCMCVPFTTALKKSYLLRCREAIIMCSIAVTRLPSSEQNLIESI